LLRICAVVAALLTGVTLAVTPRQAPGVVAGAALGILDIWLIALLVRRLLGGGGRRRRALLFGLLAAGKLVAVFFALYIIVGPAKINALGVLLGLTTVPISAGALGARELFRGTR
jgi:hypothetical protein